MQFTTFIPFEKIRTLVTEEIHHLGRCKHSDFHSTCLESIAIKANKTQRNYVRMIKRAGQRTKLDRNMISRSHLEGIVRHVLNRELKNAA